MGLEAPMILHKRLESPELCRHDGLTTVVALQLRSRKGSVPRAIWLFCLSNSVPTNQKES